MTQIAPYLSVTEHSRRKHVPVVEMVRAKLYELKNIIQKPRLAFFVLINREWLNYRRVFQNFWKCFGIPAVRSFWIMFQCLDKESTALSLGDLKCIHTRTTMSSKQLEFQCKKKGKPIPLHLSIHHFINRQELYLSMSESKSGSDNRLCDVEVNTKEVCTRLEKKGLSTKRLCFDRHYLRREDYALDIY